MSNAEQALAVSDAFERSNRQGAHIPQNIRAVCLWSLLGLTGSALAIAAGFNTELGQIFLIAG